MPEHKVVGESSSGQAFQGDKNPSPLTKSSQDDDSSGEASDAGAARRRPTATRRMSPLDIHFSQMRAREAFRDGRILEETVGLIQPVEMKEDSSDASIFLDAPFPPIEVLQWRCKLRDEVTGRPRVDRKTGGELYDSQDRWFSLDNRRLYCLQKAAIALWPAQVVADVAEVPADALPQIRARQLRKFRTLDRGRSVFIGGRGEGEKLARWSWREAAGLEDEDDPEPDASNCRVQMRRRPRREHHLAGEAPPMPGRRPSPPGSGRRERNAPPRRRESQAAAGNALLTPSMWRSVLGFVVFYTFMRLVVKFVYMTLLDKQPAPG